MSKAYNVLSGLLAVLLAGCAGAETKRTIINVARPPSAVEVSSPATVAAARLSKMISQCSGEGTGSTHVADTPLMDGRHVLNLIIGQPIGSGTLYVVPASSGSVIEIQLFQNSVKISRLLKRWAEGDETCK